MILRGGLRKDLFGNNPCELIIVILILSDKMKCIVGFADCFLRVLLVYLPYCPVLYCKGKQGEFSEDYLPNLTLQLIL